MQTINITQPSTNVVVQPSKVSLLIHNTDKTEKCCLSLLGDSPLGQVADLILHTEMLTGAGSPCRATVAVYHTGFKSELRQISKHKPTFTLSALIPEC